MADVLHMPLRPALKGRPRNQPIEGAPLAQVIEGVAFRDPLKPARAEINVLIDRIAYHLLMAGRTVQDLSQASEAYRN
jgi:hypothetical protein